MKIGLFGIRGVYNFGCEAIVRGACKFINDLYPGSEIIYYTYSEGYDKKILADLNITIKPICSEKNIMKRLINKMCRILKLNKQYLMFDYKSIIDEVDLIMSVGGDIYTIPEIVRKDKKYPYYNPLVDFCDKAIRKGKDVIVYGASVGPWGDYKKAVNYNIKALSKYKLILCREEETIDYLKGLGLSNILFFPDPAFQIRLNENREKHYIGINLSPLSLNELYGSYDEIHIQKLAKLMDKIYEELNINLMFIPHVLSSSETDNDLLFLKKIMDKMVHKQNVMFADSSNGFIGLKKYISQCYVVASARMHCAVNAIDENIPAVFLSYSQKAVGMCKYVYGNNQYLIDLKEIENSLIGKIKEAVEESDSISKKLEQRNEEIGHYFDSHIDYVKKF